MNRTEKEAHVKALSDEFQSLKNAILIDYRGLNVVNATELRREIHKLSSKYVVVKNTLARKAVKDTHLEALTEFFRDPTAIAYNDTDAVPLTKFLLDFAKTKKKITFKAGLVDGKPVSVDQLDRISRLPGRPELFSQLVYVLKAPVTKLVGVLKAPIRDLTTVLKQIPK